MVRFVKTDGTNPDFVKNCEKLDANLEEMVGKVIQRSKYAQYNTLESIHDVFVVYVEDKAAGSGGYKKYDDETVEIKRVYVDPQFRDGSWADKFWNIWKQMQGKRTMNMQFWRQVNF